MTDQVSDVLGQSVTTCPKCAAGAASVGVIDSRPWHRGVKRRRRCLACGARWATMETFWYDESQRGQMPPLDVVEAFSDLNQHMIEAAKVMARLRSVAFGINPDE